MVVFRELSEEVLPDPRQLKYYHKGRYPCFYSYVSPCKPPIVEMMGLSKKCLLFGHFPSKNIHKIIYFVKTLFIIYKIC